MQLGTERNAMLCNTGMSTPLMSYPSLPLLAPAAGEEERWESGSPRAVPNQRQHNAPVARSMADGRAAHLQPAFQDVLDDLVRSNAGMCIHGLCLVARHAEGGRRGAQRSGRPGPQDVPRATVDPLARAVEGTCFPTAPSPSWASWPNLVAQAADLLLALTPGMLASRLHGASHEAARSSEEDAAAAAKSPRATDPTGPLILSCHVSPDN